MAVLAGMFDAFVNPWLLAGLALLSAPIIIHLLNKRHFNVVEWAAMDFLLQAESRNRRRLRFEDIVLLLLRMALLALFVFAVARPIVRGLGGAREDERVVILDDSFSLDASDGAGTAFAAAKASAVTQVEEAVGRSIPVSVWSGTRPELGPIDLKAPPPGDSLASLGGALEPQGNSENSAAASRADPEEAARVLNAIRGRETTDLSLRLSAILTRLGEELDSKKAPVTRSITLVSDFRAADWFEAGTGVLRGDIASALAELKTRGALDNLRWRFIDVGQSGRENTAVTGVSLSADHPLAKVPVRIIVDVKNFGSEDRKHVTGEVEVGVFDSAAASSSPAGSSRPDATARAPIQTLHRVPLPAIDVVPAGKTAKVEVELTFDKAGKYLMTARIESDRLARDDASFAVAHVRDGLRVLAVDGDPGATRFSGESGFLLSAVAPRGTVPSGILPRRFTGEITARDARDIDVILVLNRAELTSAEKAALEEFVRQGGGVAFFLGNRVKADSYAGLSMFPAVLKSVKEMPPRTRAHLRIGENPHAAFDIFRGVEGSSLEQVGFDRYYALTPATGANVAARFDDAETTAAIIDSAPAKGRGHAAVFNMTADRDWNDWPTDPSYPIVLQEWIRYLAPKRAVAAIITAGDVLSWEPAVGLSYSVRMPGGAVEKPDANPRTDAGTKDPSGSGSGAGLLAFSGTHLAGFYAIVPAARGQASESAPDALEPRIFACRRDARESDLEPAGEARLRPALAAAGVDFVMGRDASAGVFEKAEEGETWRWLAMSAGIVLLVELFVAWWFGRR
jgi:hypothetical protein